MNKKLFLITALIFLIIGISAVSAEDINQTDDILEISDSEVISADEPAGSFTDLSEAIYDNNTGLDVKSDYKFNSTTDGNFIKGISLDLNGSKYTINGNDHIIDADNKASVFKFENGEIIINNLKITNANMSSVRLHNCILHTNNVIFENNHDNDEGGAIFVEGSDYYSNHDKFINNHAPRGASIYSLDSIIDINNSTFISDNAVHWSLIYGDNSIMTVNNTLFANITSRYATAIYSEQNQLKVLNSKFINLFANATAGAIGAKQITSLTIDGCSFINVTSSKNAGAIYADMNGAIMDPAALASAGTATVSNSIFENCSSTFAGAYLQLGGKLNMIESTFTNNTAEYIGGAIYLSDTTTLIGSSKFNKNTAKYNYGGALYIDDSDIIITHCDFMYNQAGTMGEAIYLHDSKYQIKNSQFSNSGMETIASLFDKEGSSLTNNNLNGGKTLLNQKMYNTIVSYNGKTIVLNPTQITDANASSSRFDLRDYKVNGSVSLAGVVKDQGNNGACWAFGAAGALESAFLKATGILLDLSENNIQGSALRYSDYGTTFLTEGGFSDSGMGIFLSWLGVISAEYDGYDELGKISIASFVPEESYHIQDTVIIPKRENALDNAKFKEALINYGGITVHLYGASANNNYYNPETHAQYYNGTGYGNHFVTLVGWDDTYSKDNFLIKPKGDGAWICKNSWGSDWGENGYFYVSYYDTTFAMTSTSVAFIINNTENYTTAYQYDIGHLSQYYNESGKIINFINTYDAIDNEIIKAVGTYFKNAGESYTINVYLDDDLVYTQTGKSTHGGFETIKLAKQIVVNQGQEFSVGIQAKSVPLLGNSRIHFERENSIVCHSDQSLEDLAAYNLTACIKVYTVKNPNPAESNSRYYSKDSNLTIYSNAEGKTISIYKEDEKLGSATVNGGKASFDLSLDSGSYMIITPSEDGEIIEGLKIMSTIEVHEDIKVGYKSNLFVDAKFYDKNGVELFYRNITVKLDNKVATLSIDNNEGILHLILYDMSIGEHTLILQNPETLEESVTTITVVSRFSGNSNVNMYYADGSSFKVRVYGDDGNPVGANKIVTIKLNKVTYKVKTDKKGYAKLTIPTKVKPGTYKLTATFAGQTIKNTVKVKQVLKLAKVKVKKSAKKLVIKATLKGKKPIKGKKLTFKFNGKTYKATTNSKGIAKITLKKSVLKKLKVGKKVKYQVTYLKDTVKQSVKVKK